MLIVFKTIIGLGLTVALFAIVFVLLFYKNKEDGNGGLTTQEDLGYLGAIFGMFIYIVLLYIIHKH